MIKINVGGTIFETKLDTFKKINYFKYLFEDNTVDNTVNNHVDNAVFVDRPAHVFKHVLAFAIDDTYKYPAKYRNELDFYDIVYDPHKLYDPYKKLIKRFKTDILELGNDLHYDIDNIKNKMNDLDNKLDEIINKLNLVTKQNNNICKRIGCSNDVQTDGFCASHANTCRYIYEGYYGTEYCDDTNITYSSKYEEFRCHCHN